MSLGLLLGASDLAGWGGALRVSGRADALEVSIAGAGSFEGFDLETQAAQVSVAGAGSAEVTARESFEGSVAGIGHIAYRGNPGSVEQSVSELQGASRQTRTSLPSGEQGRGAQWTYSPWSF